MFVVFPQNPDTMFVQLGVLRPEILLQHAAFDDRLTARNEIVFRGDFGIINHILEWINPLVDIEVVTLDLRLAIVTYRRELVYHSSPVGAV